MQTNADLTLFKKSIKDRAETWTRHVIRKVFWENKKAANVLRSGLLKADKVGVQIPFSSTDLEINEGDILVKGIIDVDIGGEFTPTKLKAFYPNSCVVNSVDPKDFGSAHLRHWRIGGS